jgi:uncharacterized membrane protein YfcA
MTTEQYLALGITFFIGMLLAVMGSGGSIITFPVLVYIAGIRPQAAVPMSMVIVGAASVVAAYLHARNGNFHLKAALLLGSTGVVGAYIGSTGTHLISPAALMSIFAGVLLTVGLLMFSGGLESVRPSTACRPVRCLAVGAGVGLLTGFLGVGGGFLIVPALIIFAGLEAKVAVGTSLAIISLNSAGGILGQVRYVEFQWPLTLAFTGLTLAGMLVGLSVGNRLSEETLRKVFASSLVGVGVVVGGINLLAL